MDLDYEDYRDMVGEPHEEFNPLRRLALAVIAQAVTEAEWLANRGRFAGGNNIVTAGQALARKSMLIDWLNYHAAPWCQVAGIPLARARERLTRLASAAERATAA
jgi:hypothetical protein